MQRTSFPAFNVQSITGMESLAEMYAHFLLAQSSNVRFLPSRNVRW